MSVQSQEEDKRKVDRIFEEIRLKQEKSKKKDKIWAIIGGFISVTIIGGGIWFLISHTIMPLVPTPQEVFAKLKPVLTDPWFYKSVATTTYRITMGFVIGGVLGVPYGLMVGWSRVAEDFLFPPFEILRPVPPVAWVPLSIIIFGSLEPSIIFICFIGAFFVIALNAKLGVEGIDLSIFRAAQCLGANRRQIFRQIVLPGALPAIFTGLSLGIGIAAVSVVAAEMVAGQFGIGYLAWESYNLIRFPKVIIAMITIGLIGFILISIVRLIGKRFLSWARITFQ
ncbi:MAG: ABC transporter permease [Desulfobacteraceae bacterium]|nr:ABC transporter permease [Desulfobacteraceae bacterium]